MTDEARIVKLLRGMGELQTEIRELNAELAITKGAINNFVRKEKIFRNVIMELIELE